MRNAWRQDAFTLIELMLAVAIAAIVAAIALPSLNRARAAAVEVATIGSLRALINSQATYASSCGGGLNAPSVTWLATPPAAGQRAFAPPQFVGDITDLEGYRIRFTAGPALATAPKSCNGLAAGRATQTYFIGADPLQVGPGWGRRHFGTTAGGTIYQSANRIAIFYSGSPPAPATPIH